MYISIFELMEDDGVYAAKLYKNREEVKGPYVTLWIDKRENLMTCQYKGENIYERSLDELYDDGTDVHMMPDKVTVDDMERIKDAVDKFWVNRRKN